MHDELKKIWFPLNFMFLRVINCKKKRKEKRIQLDRNVHTFLLN